MEFASSPSVRILLVDDDVDVLRAYARVLTSLGHDVATASDGTVAVSRFAEATFDLIISDVQMPHMDGLALLRFVRERDLDIPVILVTGQPSLDAATVAIEYGALRFLTKPLDIAELERVVQQALHLHEIARLKRKALGLMGVADLQVGDRAGLEVRFESALASLWMAYQPLVSWSQREIFAYEALLRCGEPALPNPGALLSAAERLERLPALGRRIRGAVAECLEQHPSVVSFVNLHARDLLDEELYSRSSPLSAFADRVVLEITERTSLDGISDVRRRVMALRRLGYRIAVDDLGAGYAGLTSLAQLEPDVVKLDMSLARSIDVEPRKRTVVASLVELCQKMQMLVVVEGIETPEERDALVAVGCDLFQGYLFARPERSFPSVHWGSEETPCARGHAQPVATTAGFAGRIAHELMNPVAVLAANIDFMAQDLGRLVEDAKRATTEPGELDLLPSRCVARAGELEESLGEARQATDRVHRIALELKELVRPSPGHPQIEQAAPRASQFGRVLIIDDDLLLLSAMKRMLEEHTVATLSCARTALEIASAGERFDAIVCDVMMPDLDGVALYEALQKLAPDQARRIIFVTGGAFVSSTRAFLDSIRNPYLEKPFAPQKLRDLVSNLLA